MKRALIHRYDNRPDILAVEARGYSDVYTRSAACESFDLVIVVPTNAADTNIAVWADAISEQYQPNGGEPWPGRPDRYPVRVNVENVRYTRRDLVREAVQQAGKTWAAAWTVMCIDIEEDLLHAASAQKVKERTSSFELSLPGEEKAGQVYSEGTVRQVLVNAYERNAAARRACIDAFGPVCCVCGFDFEEEYGRVGHGFVHVHHLRPISEIGEDYEVDPLNDLRPVCPNCHAVIHMKEPPYTIAEVQKMIRNA